MKELSDSEIVETLATRLMGFTRGELNKDWWYDRDGEVVGYFNPFSTEGAMLIRDRLSELGWNWDLGSYGYKPQLITFSMSRPGRKHDAAGETEGRAVALCALSTLAPAEGE